MRDFVIHNANDDQNCDLVILKVDAYNAFNSISRKAVLDEVFRRCPEIYPLVWEAYKDSTPLFIGKNIISSETGVQQGDPLGSLCFALGIDPVIQSLKSRINMWYLDDGTLAGPLTQVLEDAKTMITKFAALGLTLNSNKCELTCLSSKAPPAMHSQADKLLPNIKLVPRDELMLLGSAILEGGLNSSVQKAKGLIENICDRVKHLDAHTALFILCHYTSAPRFNYLLRSSPLYLDPALLQSTDVVVRNTLSQTTNVLIDDTSWKQASLPVRYGGLGVRTTESLALPSYVASTGKCSTLINKIVGYEPSRVPPMHETAVQHLKMKYPSLEAPTGEAAVSQRGWDEAVCKLEYNNLLQCSSDQIASARLRAAAAPHTGAWLQALPSPSLGLHLNADTVRISVALRIGAPVAQPHRCRCGQVVHSNGHHGLSCKNSAGRLPRHSHLNDIVRRSLLSAGIQSWLEPLGLDRGDGRRPDGLTVSPFSGGKSLCWDATCSDTFCKSVLNDSASTPGIAANRAEERKRRFYANIAENHRFEPLSVETSGVLGASTSKFVAELGRCITAITGEKRETAWLRQRLSIAIVTGNAAAVMATSNHHAP